MYIRRGLLLIGLAILDLAASQSTANGQQPVKYEIHNGYFVSNKVKMKKATEAFVIQDEKHFKKIFGIGFIAGQKTNRLKPGAFKKRFVIAVVKEDKAIFKYEVIRVYEKKGVLNVVVQANRMDRAANATFRSPLILSVPRGNYSGVTVSNQQQLIARFKVKIQP